MVNASVVSPATYVRVLQGAEFSCHHSAILRGTEPVSGLARAPFTLLSCLFYIAQLSLRSLQLFFLEFRQWQSRAGRVLLLL